MSITVPLDALLARASEQRTIPYLLTTRADGRPHAVAVSLEVREGALACPAGRTTLANVGAGAAVTLLWPPAEPGGYSLIADADAVPAPEPDALVLRVTHAVLHRPASTAAPGPTGCTSDCLPITTEEAPR